MNPKWVTNPERRVPRPGSTTSEPPRDETNNHHDQDNVPSEIEGIDTDNANTMASTRSDDYGTIDSLAEVYQLAFGASQVQTRQSHEDQDVVDSGNSEARRQRILAILQRALEVCRDGNPSESAENNSEKQ